MQRVIHDHTVRIEPPTKRMNGMFHPFDPASRQAILITIVIKRDHFVAKDAV